MKSFTYIRIVGSTSPSLPPLEEEFSKYSTAHDHRKGILLQTVIVGSILQISKVVHQIEMINLILQVSCDIASMYQSDCSDMLHLSNLIGTCNVKGHLSNLIGTCNVKGHLSNLTGLYLQVPPLHGRVCHTIL